MDERSRVLLAEFDAARGGDANEVDVSSLGEGANWWEVAEELVLHGWLQPGSAPGRYMRTEDGRLMLAGPLDVTLYTRPGCHLCDQAKAEIDPLLRNAGARLREVNIDEDRELRERYNVDVPVVFLGARKVAKHKVNLEQLRRQLDEAVRSQEPR